MLMSYCDFYGVGVVKIMDYSAVPQFDCFLQLGFLKLQENKHYSTDTVNENTVIILLMKIRL